MWPWLRLQVSDGLACWQAHSLGDAVAAGQHACDAERASLHHNIGLCERSTTARIPPAPPFPGCPGSVLPLEHLEQVQDAAADFAAAAFIALGGSGTSAAGSSSSSALPPADFAAVQQRILAPVEEALLQYGDRELAFLTAELARLAAQGEPGWCVVKQAATG